MFLDILGFSQLVINNEPSQLRQIYDSEIHQTAGACTLLSADMFGSKQDFKISAKRNGVLHDVEQRSINFHVLSDSLIAWTEDTSLDSLINLSQYAVTYLSMTFSLGLPHRGAISIGDVQIVELPLNGRLQSNVVGSGVVKAHNFEIGQEWMGCVVDPACINALSATDVHEFFRMHKCPVVRCSPPYNKKAKFKSDLAVNWTFFDTLLKDDYTYFAEQFSRHNKRQDGIANEKIQNTYEFYKQHSTSNDNKELTNRS